MKKPAISPRVEALQARPEIKTRPELRSGYLSLTLGLVFAFVPSAARAEHPASAHGLNNSWNTMAGRNFSPAALPQSPATAPNTNIFGAATAATFNSAHTGSQQTNPYQQHGDISFYLPKYQNGLDLTSTKPVYSLSGLTGLQTISIVVGGKTEIVDINSKLTGAELVAAGQVLAGGQQTLTINKNGAATGGVFNIDNQTLGTIDAALGTLQNFTVASGVKAIDTLSNFQLPGNLVNHGHILAQPEVGDTSTIHAGAIYNTAGAYIGTGNNGGNLNLVTENGLYNGGTISAGGNLNISSPYVVNVGTLQSTEGNVNFSSDTAAIINNQFGTINAVAGNINVSTQTNNGDVDIFGGDLLSKNLNINAGTGKVNVDVDDVTGLVNIDACGAHVTAATPNLQLGTLNVTGDPTYYNQGNITISGAIAPTGGQPLAIVASGNILSNGGSLDTSSTTGNGGDLTLIAGANFVTSNNSKSGNNNSSTTLTILNGPGSGNGSISGGLIDLTGKNGGKAPIININVAGGGAFGSAGDIMIVAFSGKAANSGSVTTPQNVSIDAGTNGGFAANGSISIYAGATKGTAISTGDLTNSRAAIPLGTITLQAEKIQVATPVVILDGAIMSGNIVTASNTTQGAIKIGNVTTNGGAFNSSNQSTLSFGTINTSGSGGFAVPTGPGNDGRKGGDVFIIAGSTTGKNILSFGGGGGGGSSVGNDGSNGGKGGDGGIITVVNATGGMTLTGVINNSGGGGGGGAGASYDGTAGNFGAGGAGGTGGIIQLSSVKAPVIAGGVFSANGGVGGAGGVVVGTQGGNGGGGGGSYGGGGGGGAAGNDLAIGGNGGGGGGGYYGGGGGSGVLSVGNTSGTGGGGGGFGAGGARGQGSITGNDGFDGSKNKGGNGAFFSVLNTYGIGGVLADGGTRGVDSSGGAGVDGDNVIINGAFSGGTLFIQTNTGNVGSPASPLMTTVKAISMQVLTTKSKSGFYVENAGDLTVSSALIFGPLSVKAAGDIIMPTSAAGAPQVSLTTKAGSNGSITLKGNILADKLNMQVDGTGTITQTAGKIIASDFVVIKAKEGAVGQLDLGFFPTDLTVNSNASVTIVGTGNLTVQKSSTGDGSLSITTAGTLTTKGVLSTNNQMVSLKSGENLVLGADIAASFVTLVGTGSANITQKGSALSAPNLGVVIDAGTFGTKASPFKTSSPNIAVNGNMVDLNNTGFYINDTNTGTVTINNVGNWADTFSVSSVAANLKITTGAFVNVDIKNTSTAGSITLTGQVGGNGETKISTVNGVVVQSAGTLAGNFVTLTSKGGSFGPAGIKLDADQLSITTGPTSTNIFTSNKSMTLINATVGTLTIQGANLLINGPVKATNQFTAAVGIMESGVYINETGSITGGVIQLKALQGNVSVYGPINAASVLISANKGGSAFADGQLTVANTIGNGTGPVALSATAGIVRVGAGKIAGDSVSLSAAYAGTVSVPLIMTAAKLSFNTTGGVYANLSGNTVLNTSGADTLTLNTPGSVTLGANQMLTVNNTASISATSFATQKSSVTTAGRVVVVTTGPGTAIDLEAPFTTADLTLVTAAKSAIGMGITSNGFTVLASKMNLQTGTLTNNINLTTTLLAMPAGLITIANPGGDLTINNGATGKIANPITFSATSGGNLKFVNSGTLSPFISTTGVNTLTLSAKGLLTLPSNTVTVVSDVANNGGTISISAGTLVHPNGTLVFTANAATAMTGDGGTISVALTGKQNVRVDFGANDMRFVATGGTTGGAGGSVSVSTGGDLFYSAINNGIIVNPLANDNDGGSISLVAGGRLQVEGSALTLGKGTGAAGALNLSSGDKSNFVVGLSAIDAKSNGTTGNIQGGNTTVTAAGAIDVRSGKGIFTVGSLVTLNSPKIINNNGAQIGSSTGSAISITLNNSKGDLTIINNGSWTNTFQFVASSSGNLNLGTLAIGTDFSAKIARISAGKTLTLGNTNISVGTVFNGGGTIDIKADKLAYITPNPILLFAEGDTAGGVVNFNITGKNDLTIGVGGANHIQIKNGPTNAAPMSGGTINVSTGGNLKVDLNTIQNNNLNLATLDSNLTLKAGGNLLITSPWKNSVVGDGGKLTIASNSSKTFVIGVPTTNGINTAAKIDTGFISISNSGGSVTIGGQNFLTGANNVTVNAAKNITGPTNNSAITAPSVVLSSNGGSIGVGANGTPSDSLRVNTDNLTADAGIAGSVYLLNLKNSPLTINGGSAKFYTLQTAQKATVAGPLLTTNTTISTVANAGDILITDVLGNGLGQVSLVAGAGLGGIAQTGGTVNATSLFIQGNTISLKTNVTGLSGAAAGNLTINNIGSKLLTLGNLVSQGTLGLTTGGAILQSGGVSGVTGVTYNSGGAITINGALSTINSTVALNASNGGAITEAAGGKISSVNVQLFSDSGDIKTDKGTLVANNISVGTTGNINLVDNLPAGGNITLSPLTTTAKSFTLKATASSGTLSVDSIKTSNGSINVIFTGVTLKTATDAQIFAGEGNILLQNLSNTNTILIGKGTNIYGSSVKAGLGNVTIAVGAVPMSPVAGTPPAANTQASFTPGGKIFYGTTGVLKANAGTNFLNAFGRNIVFSALQPNSITLNGDVVITADPPFPSGMPTITSEPTPAARQAIQYLQPTSAVVSTTTSQTIINTSAPASAQSMAQRVLPNNYGNFTSRFDTSSLAGITSQIGSAQTGRYDLQATSQTLPGTKLRGGVTMAGQPGQQLHNEARLIVADKDTILHSEFGSITLKNKSMSLILSTPRGLTIFNLDDCHKDSVRVSVGGKSITVEPGRHLTITDSSAADFAKINPARFIAHRGMAKGEIGEFRTFRSEFHLLSAITGLQQLREFLTSSDPAKREAARHLLKTAAILNGLMQNNRERFEFFNENLVTAMRH